MSEKDDKQFEKTVSEFLAQGLHTRRGLTAEQYTAVCKKAWDECQSSPEFPFKVLTDPLQSTEKLFENFGREYIHWRAADELELQKDPSTDIRCVALGEVKPDLSTGPDERPTLPTDEPEIPETRKYILAVFDVLGFSAMLAEKGLSEVTALYSRLITEAVTKEAMRTYTIIRFSETQKGSIVGALPVSHAHFSDTILLWVPLVQHFIDPFLARCADMVCEALKLGIPLRGAVAVGPAVMHARTDTFVGSPVVEAAKLEQSQDWLGVSLGPSMLAGDVSSEFDPTLVIPYPVPFKKQRERVYAELALDWPNRFRSRFGTDPLEAIRAIDTSPSHHIYYVNALKFAEFSGGPIFRSEGFRRPNLGELADAAIVARRTGNAFSPHHQFVLKDLARTGKDGNTVAEFVRAIAAGKPPPKIPRDLARGLKQYLRELSLAIGENAKFFEMLPCAIEVVCMRLCGLPLSQTANDTLNELARYGQDGKEASEFLRDLSIGGEPSIPKKLSGGMSSFLKQGLEWVKEGKVPKGLFKYVAEECLNARMGDRKLNDTVLRALAALEATNETWSSVAGFLRSISTGDDPPIPVNVPEPTYSNLVRVSLSSRVAGVQPPRTLEVISVGFGDPFTGIDLFLLVNTLSKVSGQLAELPANVDEAIKEFEESASQRAIVGQTLRALFTGQALPRTRKKLPVAIRLILTQINAVSRGRPIPLDPSLVGFAAIRTRHGGGPIGDCIMFSLQAMAAGSAETKTLANYLWSVANGGPAGSAPLLQEPWLAATAEEVRCLAEPQVGGIRMMMRPAKPRAQPSAGTCPNKT
jgi:hypothetical protein